MYTTRYNQTYKNQWDEFVRHSKNGTFLLLRDYMEYHRDRFEDHSLIIFDEDKKTILALLPANQQENKIISHQGLTYGGLIINANMTQPKVIALFAAIKAYYIEQGFKQFLYKTIPNIYHRVPADEDHYALFLQQASIYRRDVLTVIDNAKPLPFQERRKRQIKKAKTAQLSVRQTEDFMGFWIILEQNLREKYQVSPVHSSNEMILLAEKFPEHIKLFGCYDQGQILAGVLVYETDLVAHFQYISVHHQGKTVGALDFLFNELIQVIYRNKRYIDFGISNEQNGRVLNTGLIEFKEGFGGRSIKHDQYLLILGE